MKPLHIQACNRDSDCLPVPVFQLSPWRSRSVLPVLSGWRFINDGNYNNVADIDTIKQMFRVREIKGNVIGATPYVFKHPRDIEILRYIKSNNIQDTKIVVIDDLREAGEAIRDIPDSLFIWTDYNTGLTKEEANKAIEFLNEENRI